MGFFDSLLNTMNVDVVRMNRDIDEDDNNYRRKGFENTDSNYGWYKCVKCGKSYRKGDMHIDHIMPKSLGGSNDRENLQCICKHCNCSKRADTKDTYKDLSRRKKELQEQDRDDREFLKRLK